MDSTDGGGRQRRASKAPNANPNLAPNTTSTSPNLDTFTQQLDTLAYLTWRNRRHKLRNRPVPKTALSEVCESWSMREYLLAVLLFLFFGTSMVYTYLTVLVTELNPSAAALGALHSRKISFPKGQSLHIPPPRPKISPEEEERLRRIREENYFMDSDVIKDSTMLMAANRIPSCPSISPDEKHDFNVTTSHVCMSKHPPYGGRRLLTLFTTKYDHVVEQMMHTYNNLLQMWPRLGARVRTILFVTDPDEEKDMIKNACSLGWDVVVAPACDDDGAPYLADMFLAAKQLEWSHFYGYAHRSTLFDMSVLRTLMFLQGQMDSFPDNLIVGQRTNLRLLKFRPEIKSMKDLMKQTRVRGTLGWLLEVDYFLTTRSGFTPPAYIAIGTKHLGNLMVYTALSRQIPVIDISNTTIATHQMAWTSPLKVVFSEAPLPDGFEPTNGMVWCAPLRTRELSGRLYLMKRVGFNLCGPSQWSRLPINHPNMPTDREEEFMRGGSIMFPRQDEQLT